MNEKASPHGQRISSYLTDTRVIVNYKLGFTSFTALTKLTSIQLAYNQSRKQMQ